MKIQIAYNELIKHKRKAHYTTNSATLVYDRGWTWIVVFQALNYSNYAVVKYYNGCYSVEEL